MTSPELELPANLATAIEQCARRMRPLEFCGALLGDDNGKRLTATDLVRLQNSDTRQGRFSLSDAQVAHAELAARERGLTLVALVHSHPASSPVLSPADRAAIRHSAYLWTIAGFDEYDRFELAAFQPRSALPVAVRVRAELQASPA